MAKSTSPVSGTEAHISPERERKAARWWKAKILRDDAPRSLLRTVTELGQMAGVGNTVPTAGPVGAEAGPSE